MVLWKLSYTFVIVIEKNNNIQITTITPTLTKNQNDNLPDPSEDVDLFVKIPSFLLYDDPFEGVKDSS